MQLHIAALRVLAKFDGHGHDTVRREFSKNQLELGYAERLSIGRSSLLRLFAYRGTTNADDSDKVIEDVLKWSTPDVLPRYDMFSSALRPYISGDTGKAVRLLSADGPEILYGRAMLMLEAGQVQQAAENFQQFVTEFSGHRLAAAAETALKSLALEI
jgi:hypothetical protein